MPKPRSISLVAVGALAMAACRDTTQPLEPGGESATPIAALAPDIAVTLDDARLRLVPTLDPSMRARVAEALATFDLALTSGDAPEARRALATARAVLAAHTNVDGDAADVSAISVALDLADARLTEAR